MLEEAKIVSFDVGLRVYIAHAQEREREREIDSERERFREKRREREKKKNVSSFALARVKEGRVIFDSKKSTEKTKMIF